MPEPHVMTSAVAALRDIAPLLIAARPHDRIKRGV